MKIYTLDGTLITAAWGEDPATAGPGNPDLDIGTTIPPFPVPTGFPDLNGSLGWRRLF